MISPVDLPTNTIKVRRRLIFYKVFLGMKFRLLMACVMGVITPSISTKIENNINPFPVLENPDNISIIDYKNYSFALLEKIEKDLKILMLP